MIESWRVFAAIELPREVRERIQSHVVELREVDKENSASWTRVENIHLTLKFFGQIAIDNLPEISSAIESACRGIEPFSIAVGDVGVFPRQSSPKVLWLGVSSKENKLAALQHLIEAGCGRAGFPKEERDFKPHFTIGRIRNRSGGKELAAHHLKMQFESIDFEVREVVLFRSELNPKGSRYTSISRHTLTF